VGEVGVMVVGAAEGWLVEGRLVGNKDGEWVVGYEEG